MSGVAQGPLVACRAGRGRRKEKPIPLQQRRVYERVLRAGVPSLLGLSVAVVVAMLAAADAPAISGRDVITTIAGTKRSGYSGDGGRATAAQLSHPIELAAGRDGSLYVLELGNRTVRRIGPTGIISTVAGTAGKVGCSGEGGPARSALLQDPNTIAVDRHGVIYIGDGCPGSAIRKVDPDGKFTRFAGDGRTFGGYHGDGGPALAAGISVVGGLVVDEKDNVYLSDTFNNCVRMITPAGIIKRVAAVCDNSPTARSSGDGGSALDARINRPGGLAVDDRGNLYIAEYGQNSAFGGVVRKVDRNGRISTLAGRVGVHRYSGDGGPASKATFEKSPSDVAVDGAGNVYISDAFRVRKVDLRGRITTVAGGPIYPNRWPTGSVGDGLPAIKAKVDGPRGLVVDTHGNLYIAHQLWHIVRKIANRLPIPRFAQTAASGSAPVAVKFDASGSRDPNGVVVRFSWEFGDGATGAGRKVTHVYERAGTYKVTLRVMDDSGGTAALTLQITIR